MSPISVIITIAAYFVILFTISYIAGRKADNEGFFVGNRKSAWYVVAFAMIGSSISGVTYVSVPGMVAASSFGYLQMVLGFVAGQFIIAFVLTPLFYRMNLVSIYEYLENRFGMSSYRTGAWFFFISKMLGAAVRLFLVCLTLQLLVFEPFGLPFILNVAITVALVWLYTFRGGVKSLIWTDSLKTFCLVVSVVLCISYIASDLNLSLSSMISTIADSDMSRIFFFDDVNSKQYFFKQFFAGAFTMIAMTGLDQDMMQKNLSCKNLHEAQKNMYCYGISFVPVNFLFLSLGILLLLFASQLNIPLPAAGDEILPLFAAEGHLGFAVLIFFTIGIIAAAFSSADSALTALTTSFCIDIAGISHLSGKEAERRRKLVHFCISVLFIGFILLFKAVNNKSVIDAIYTIASYTYGPLLGLFAFGLFTPMRPRDRFVPYIAIASPLLCYAIDRLVFTSTGYQFGYEMLMFNGFLTFMGLTCLSIKTKNYGNTQCRICSK